MLKRYAVCLMGPTCIGKTDLSIKLLASFPFEIISVDSSMIFKSMNIGTGKPHLYLLNKFKHNLINICDPCDKYSVFDFCRDSLLIMRDCWKRGKIPLFVGGTMMYFWMLQRNFYFNISTYSSLMNKYLIEPSFFSFKFLDELSRDLIKSDRVKLFDMSYSCNSISSLNKNYFAMTEYCNFLNIAIVPIDKYKLYSRIRKRFYKMLRLGLIDEVYSLYTRMDLHLMNQSIRSIGYKDFWLYFDNKLSFKNTMESVVDSTISLSNRQMFWLKKWRDDLIYIEDTDRNILPRVLCFINKWII